MVNYIYFSKFFLATIASLLLPYLGEASDSPAPTWISNARHLKDEDSHTLEKAMKALREDATLANELKESFQKKKNLEEAMLVCQIVKPAGIFAELLQFAKQYPSYRALMAIDALPESMNNNEFAALIETLVGNQWSSLDGATKLMCLQLAAKMDIKLDASILKKAVEDNNSQIVIFALGLSGKYFREGVDKSFAPIIASGLHDSPYQIKLASLYAIQSLKENQRADFAKEINICVNDKNQQVKKICASLKGDLHEK